jgi:hypothetical protein
LLRFDSIIESLDVVLSDIRNLLIPLLIV